MNECQPMYWRGAPTGAALGIATQGSVTVDFTACCPKVRFDSKGRASNRYRIEHVLVVRIGPNTLGNAVVDGVDAGGGDFPGFVGIPQSTAGPLIPMEYRLSSDWNPRTVRVTFTNQSSVSSSFQVAVGVRDLGPDDGYQPTEG